MNGISVIVCCYNSASRLPLALEYLSKQKTYKDLRWEIIIVNNNSNDNTVEIAKQIWKLYVSNTQLKIVDESEPGLSYARQAGVKAALYDIIVFCDDDNLLAENYLQYAYNLIKEKEERGYAIFGGKSEAVFETNVKVPEWFEKEKANYVVGKQADKTGDVSSRGYIWGAGMIILKRVFQKVTGSMFPLLLTGRKNNSLMAGDDSEICLRSLILGYKLYYDENLTFKHYITENKLTPAYNAGLIKGFIVSDKILSKYKIFIHYISGRNSFFRSWYVSIYLLKFFLSRIKLRSLTDFDLKVVHALFQNKFKDADFGLMHSLLKLRTQST